MFSLTTLIIILSTFSVSAFGFCEGDKDGRYIFLRNYNGTIGEKYNIRMTITIKDNEINGVYFYTSQLKDINVQGKILDGTKFVMDEFDSQDIITGHFEGEFPEKDPRGAFGASKLQC